MKIDITEMFCFVGDFCKFIKEELTKRALEVGIKTRRLTRIPDLTEAEIISLPQIIMQKFQVFLQILPSSI